MNSTVRNNFTVLVLSSALVLGLVVAAPALPRADVAAPQSSAAFATTLEADAARVGEGAMIATLTAEAPVVAGLATTFQNPATTPATAKSARRKSGKSSRIRQSMAMPFFSFASRG